jgi:signal transduction histidine kinase
VTEPRNPRRPRASIFVKLFFTMLTMAIIIVSMISGFFFFLLAPTVGQSIDRLTAEHIKLLVDEQPDLERARAIAARLDLDLRYESRDGSWSTAPDMPTIAEARRTEQGELLHPPTLGRQYHVVARPDGSSYLIAWRYHSRLRRAHDKLLALLSLAVVVVVLIAYGILRRVLRPIGWLHAGFANLGQGDLDATVRRRTDDELGVLTDAFNHMVGHVREMVKSRDQLLLDVSHELRSPLTRMKVALALCSEDQQKTRLLANVAEMESLVAELLEIERLKGGRGITRERTDLTALVRAAAERFGERAPGVVVDALPRQVWISIDRDKIRTALNNLLDNAIKYSLPDSQPVRIFVTEDARAIHVHVDDDGPGIPEQDLPHLFEPFFRVDRSRSRKTGGYGLGLSLCERIMLAHGGSIRAKNRPQRGACLILSLPISQ